MTKLKWKGNTTTDEHFVVQSAQVRGEGIHYYLVGMSAVEQAVADDFGIETCFFGRGGVSKVKAAAQRIADLSQRRLADEAERPDGDAA